MVDKPAYKGIMKRTHVESDIPLKNSLIDRVVAKRKFDAEEYKSLLERSGGDSDLTDPEKVRLSDYNQFFTETLGIKDQAEIESQLLQRQAIKAGNNRRGLPDWVNTRNFLKTALLATAFGFTMFCVDGSLSAERKLDRCMRHCVPAFRDQFTFNPSSSGDHLHYWALDTTQHWMSVPKDYEGAELCTYANLTKLREDGEIDGLSDLQLPEKSDEQLYSATCDDFCRISCGRFKKTVGQCMGEQLKSGTELVLDVTVPVTEAVLESAGEVAETAGTTVSDFLTDVMDGTGWILFGVMAVLLLLVFT